MELQGLIAKFWDAWNAHDADALGERFSNDVAGAWHTGPTPLRLNSRIDVLTHWKREWAACPDVTFTVRRAVADAKTAAVQGLWSGTLTGTMVMPDGPEVPPTGRHAEVEMALFLTFRDDEVVAFDAYFDSVLLLIGLGLMPGPADSPA